MDEPAINIKKLFAVFVLSLGITCAYMLIQDPLLGPDIAKKTKRVIGILTYDPSVEGEAEPFYLAGQEDQVKADKLVASLKKAADGGNERSQYLFSYLNGRNGPTNVEQGLHYLELSAEQGYAKAQYDLAYWYSYAPHNKGEKDMNKAMHWFEKAANQNDADAQYALGYSYAIGKKDYKTGKYWLNKAAARNHKPSQDLLLRLNKTGR